MERHVGVAHDLTKPTFGEMFTPKLVTVLREGYDLPKFRRDLLAGLTVAIVALPLSMAIAIASGVSPDKGLFTAIVGGFIVSALGGSRFQIGGPAGAFIVLVAATVEAHGIDGLLLATMLAGLFLLAIGYLRLGTFIKFIPYPVTVGFTAGIAVIIFSSQLHDLFGLTLSVKEPGELVPKLVATPAAAARERAQASVDLATVLLLMPCRRRGPVFSPAVAAGIARVLLRAWMWLAGSMPRLWQRNRGIPTARTYPAAFLRTM